jgi:hypothetical protein
VLRNRIARRAGVEGAEGSLSGSLRGHVDVVSELRIAGWAQQLEQPAIPVCLDIYSRNRLLAAASQNRYRYDPSSRCRGAALRRRATLRVRCVRARGEADNVGQVGQLHVTRPTTGPVHGVPAGPGTGRGRGRSGPPDPSRSLAASREVAAGVGGARNSQYFTVRPSVTTVQQNRYATRTKHFLARTKRCPARAERYAGAKNIPESGRTR